MHVISATIDQVLLNSKFWKIWIGKNLDVFFGWDLEVFFLNSKASLEKFGFSELQCACIDYCCHFVLSWEVLFTKKKPALIEGACKNDVKVFSCKIMKNDLGALFPLSIELTLIGVTLRALYVAMPVPLYIIYLLIPEHLNAHSYFALCKESF